MAAPDTDLSDLPSDADEEETLRYAISLSLREHEKATGKSVESKSSNENNSGSKQPPKTSFGSIMLDRKAMEEERLRRQAAKRPRAVEEDDEIVEVPAPKRKTVSAPSRASTVAAHPEPQRTNYFPNGAVKRTWAQGYPRTADDIKIEEVFQKERLELAVLSSFQWDEEWMLSKLNIRRTRLLLVAFAADEAQREAMRENAPPNVRFCFPPMKGMGAMHSKLQLLKYPDSLRIVVPTGNLTPYDWGESGVLENVIAPILVMLFLIDLPRLADPSDHRHTRFSEELVRFLEASGVDEKLISSLSNYDFSRTERLAFVHTIPGGHSDDLRRHTGYCGLGDSVTALGLATDAPVEIDIVSASLGALNSDLVEAMYNACQGDNGMKEYKTRTSRKPGSKSTSTPQKLQDHVRIYFPTQQTVVKSRGGTRAAGTICVQAKWWQAPAFPKELVRDCASTREGLLMHSKLILVRKASQSDESGAAANSYPRSHTTPYWAYVGSANLSESAWGRLVKDTKTGKPKMSCRNWECGVVVSVVTNSKDAELDLEKQEALGAIFGGTVPVPMKTPGRLYGPGEEPWYYAANH